MSEKNLEQKKKRLLDKISQSSMGKAVKAMALTTLLAGKSLGSKAATVDVKDAQTNAVEQRVNAMPSEQMASFDKKEKFNEIPELSPYVAAFVDHTYIIDQKMWSERDTIVLKCVDSRYVQDLSLTDVACARECKALPKDRQTADGYISFNRDPGVIGSDGKATYNGIISTDFNATKQSIILMCCSNDEKIAALGKQMVNGDCSELISRIKKKIYHEDGTTASPAELQKTFADKDFIFMRNKIKNRDNRAAFNLMYQKVCRSDVESSIKFQEQYALVFYGIGRKGNLTTLNQKIKEANGNKADLTKVNPAVIGAALSEMIAKGHGTLAANPMMLKLNVLNNTGSSTNITNARVLGPTARQQADKQSKYDYLTLKMVDELFSITNNLDFYEKVQQKVAEQEQQIERARKIDLKRSAVVSEETLNIKPIIKPKELKIDTFQLKQMLDRKNRKR